MATLAPASRGRFRGSRDVVARRSRAPGGDTLDTYFDEIGKVDLLTPEDETRMAGEIQEIELELWKQCFSYAPGRKAVRAAVKHAFVELKKEAPAKLAPEETRPLDPDKVALDAAIAAVAQEAKARPDSAPARAWHKRVQGLQAASIRSRKNFAGANLRLVVKVAREFDYGRMPLPDLIQEGNVGLLQAIGRYDHSRGVRFATYAVWWIRHAVRRALVNKGRGVRLPNHITGAGRRILSAIDDMTNKLGRVPEVAEVAEVVDMTPEKVEQVQAALMQTEVSFDAPEYAGDEGKSLLETLSDPDQDDISLEDVITSQAALAGVLEILPSLTDIELDVVNRRFGLNGHETATLAEIGKQHSLSRERIRQLQRQALDKLRRGLLREGLM